MNSRTPESARDIKPTTPKDNLALHGTHEYERIGVLQCPLCFHTVEPYIKDRLRSYLHCPRCDLVSVSPECHLDETAEKSYYDLHENDPADQGYRRFLGRLSGPLLGRLSRGMRGLDYGCGPGPTLSIMLEEAGMLMDDYDPYYSCLLYTSPSPRD